MGASEGDHTSLIGTELAGYEVLGRIGRGAMGTVYLARDVSLNRYVALKVLRASLARDPSIVKDFHREAQVAAPLKHPNIVRIYSAGTKDNIPYIVMKYVKGEPLDRFLSRKGRIRWQSALYIGGQIAEALHYAHQQGIIHRDVKPGNMILDRHGQVRLTDFGIANAKIKDGSTPKNGGFVGTLQYMSPEQCAGRELSPSTDLFSLGVMLYQMIAGQLPFEAESPVELMKRIATDEPPRLNKIVPDVPDDVARLVAYLLQKRPEDRPKDAQAVSVTIKWLQDQKGDQSAWPAALSAFVREQGDIPPSRTTDAPAPHAKGTWRGDKVQNGDGSVSLRDPFTLHSPRLLKKLRHALWATATLLAFWCCAVGAFSATRHHPPQPIEAAYVDNLAFEPLGSGALMASFLADGYRFTDLCWVGDRPVVVVQVEGIDGALTHGASGLIAVDPDSQQCLSLREPTGPALDADFFRSHVKASHFRRIPATAPGTPLHETVFRYAYQNHRTGRSIVILAQHWREAEPSLTVLHRAPPQPWHSPVGWVYDSSHYDPTCIHAAAKPDGYTLCLVVNSPTGQGDYLVERDVRWAPDLVGAPLTTAEAPIVPETVHYSPDGSLIGYMRVRGSERELWVVAPGGYEKNGLALAIGQLGPYCAFSPDSRYMAIDTETAASGEPEIRIMNAIDGTLGARLGPGRLGKEPWHPSGRYVLATLGEDSGDTQMWALEVAPPHRRVQLTRGPGSVTHGCAVSRTGRWAVAVAAETHRPTLVFVDLSFVSFRDTRLPAYDRTS